MQLLYFTSNYSIDKRLIIQYHVHSIAVLEEHPMSQAIRSKVKVEWMSAIYTVVVNFDNKPQYILSPCTYISLH